MVKFWSKPNSLKELYHLHCQARHNPSKKCALMRLSSKLTTWKTQWASIIPFRTLSKAISEDQGHLQTLFILLMRLGIQIHYHSRVDSRNVTNRSVNQLPTWIKDFEVVTHPLKKMKLKMWPLKYGMTQKSVPISTWKNQSHQGS